MEVWYRTKLIAKKKRNKKHFKRCVKLGKTIIHNCRYGTGTIPYKTTTKRELYS